MPDDWDLPEGQTQYSEVDELKARLAEVTAERDRLSDDYMDLLDGANKTGMDLAHLLDAVEAYDTANRESDPVVWKRLGQLVTLAAKIRKERS